MLYMIILLYVLTVEFHPTHRSQAHARVIDATLQNILLHPMSVSYTLIKLANEEGSESAAETLSDASVHLHEDANLAFPEMCR